MDNRNLSRIDQPLGLQALIDKHDRELADLRRKIAYYEEPLPVMDNSGHYEKLNGHRFTDDGVCVRCGEDMEGWDAGCVEELVDDLRSVCHPEFVEALHRVIYLKYTAEDDQVVKKYLERIEKFSRQFAWEEGDPGAMDMVEPADGDDDFSIDL